MLRHGLFRCLLFPGGIFQAEDEKAVLYVHIQLDGGLLSAGIQHTGHGVVHQIHHQGAKLRIGQRQLPGRVGAHKLNAHAPIDGLGQLAVDDHIQHVISALNHRADLFILAQQLIQIPTDVFLPGHLPQQGEMLVHVVQQHHDLLILRPQALIMGHGQFIAF